MDILKTGPRKAVPRTARGKTACPLAPLQTYREKRDFGRTPEPSGGRSGKRRSSPVYIIQLHRASHLHYDLRLEEGGVLKSWAIPKTPPERPGDKRLAVETEDHPLGYASFEGSIPEGEYGAGTVVIWDRGTYDPLATTPVQRVINIRGRKLKGVYALIKLRAKKGRKDKNWLFFKTGQDGTPESKRKTP